MFIKDLVSRDFKTIKPYQGVETIKNDLVAKNALVVMDKGVYVGLLTPRDVVIKSHNLVIDCILPKPSLSSKDVLENALDLMKSENTDVLSVIDEGIFVGLVNKTDIMLLLNKINLERQEHIRTIVHDLRNPIANISGLAEMLRINLEKDKQELLGYAEDACVFASDILDDLLMSAEMEEGVSKLSKEKTDVVAFLKSCLHSISGAAMVKDIEFKDSLPDTAFLLKFDKLKLRRAVLNILSNAIKFTPKKGAVKVSATIKKTKIVISIADNGIGIPQPLQPIIFQKFTKAKRQGTDNEKTTGLGMYITKQLIKQHNGKIWFESKEGKGTTFFIELNKITKE